MKLRVLLLAGLLAGLLSGCTTDLHRAIDANVDVQNQRVAEIQGQAREGKPRIASQSRPAIEKVDGIWLPFRRQSDVRAEASAKDAATRRFTVSRDFRNLQEVAERVTLLTGIPVHVAPDALAPIAGQAVAPAGAAAGANAAGAVNPNIPSLPSITGNPIQMGSLSQQLPAPPASALVALNYDGPLTGFLDVAAARFGASWEWSGKGINVFRHTTRIFRLVALPGDSTLSNNITSQSGGSGSGGSGGGSSVGGNSTAGISIAGLSVWTAVSDAVKGMLSSRGTHSVNAATGTVMVTDTPQVLARVAKFIEEQNASLSKQVMVNVRILALDLEDEDQYGINWSAFYGSLSNNVNVQYQGQYASSALASILRFAGDLTNADVNSTPKTAAYSSQGWRGSSAIISALSTQGRVSQLTSTSLLTLNNQPAPLQVGRQTAYLASSSSTVSAGVGITTTLTPGLVTSGFSMSVVPHILDRGKLLLQFAINLSSEPVMNTMSDKEGKTQIQTPRIDTRNFLQRVMITSGDTLVLTGFEQEYGSNQSSGTGGSRSFLLGGGIEGARKRSTLVILVQPIVSEGT